jgi:hypothetical protein
MDWIIVIRIIIWLTFFLLIIEGIAGIIVISKFYRLYIREHIKLEKRVAALERRYELETPGAHD